jgi:hypothetical protein
MLLEVGRQHDSLEGLSTKASRMNGGGLDDGLEFALIGL